MPQLGQAEGGETSDREYRDLCLTNSDASIECWMGVDFVQFCMSGRVFASKT